MLLRHAPARVPASVLLVASLLATLLVALPARADAAPLTPTDGTYSAEILRTDFGIPHIVAEDWGSLGFGQGYGAAEDIICSLADTVVTVRGQRSKYFGADEIYDDQVTLTATNLQTDTLFGDIVNRGVVEELLASEDPGVTPGEETRAMVDGYVAGINQYLEDVGGADGIDDPTCKGAPWVTEAEPIDLWRGIYAAELLASTGVFVPQIVDAAPPGTNGETGLPDELPGTLLPGGLVPSGGLPVEGAGFVAPPEQLPSSEDLTAALRGGGEEQPFGSNGTALGGEVTDTGRGMVLGNPHFPWQGRYRFTQSQLTIPGEYDVRGAMLHGSPVVNIGWNDDVAWTHTVSTAYRFTPYEYPLVPGLPTRYVRDGEVRELERREVEVELQDGSTVTEDLYRTDEGYVIDDDGTGATMGLTTWSPVSVWALRDVNAEHLKTLDAFHEMGKSGSVDELAAAQIRTSGIPWVNTMAADRDGEILYADNSVVPHVTDELVQQCATAVGRVLFQLAGLPGLDGSRAGGDCAWGSDDDAPRDGILGEANLPDSRSDDADPDWVVNANDSYWLPNPDAPLTGFDRIIGCEECERSLRTRMVYRYVIDRLDGSDGLGGEDEFTHQQLMDIQTVNRVFAAELAREGGDLQTVCSIALPDNAEACTALADWDGLTDTDSRGAALFREFWGGTNAMTRWTTPFDASDPVGTPNGLNPADPQNLQAMRDAVSTLDDAGVAYDAPLGQVQKAGDPSAGAIAVQGGFGSTGNANVVSVRAPLTANEDVLYPITYGSSHIQAVAYTDDGVDACTILTYGQSTNGAGDHHDDQTALWSGEEWVCWPDDVRAASDGGTTVTGPVADPTDDDQDGDDQDGDTGGGAVDGTAPDTTITEDPGPGSTSSSVRFRFRSDDATARFECRLTGDRTTDFGACASPRDMRLPDGTYRFAVRALDTAGNADQSPAVHSFTIDTRDTFRDDEDSVFEADIEELHAADITRGCNPPDNDRFCPDANVTREQMAAFLTRALNLPAASEQFRDVGGDNIFADDIGALAASDVTRGCNPPDNDEFCPEEFVTREQMAAFLRRGLDLPGAAEMFDDVRSDNVFARDIGGIAEADITRGCNPPDNDEFCPGSFVTRGQMAAFLVRAGLT